MLSGKPPIMLYVANPGARTSRKVHLDTAAAAVARGVRVVKKRRRMRRRIVRVRIVATVKMMMPISTSVPCRKGTSMTFRNTGLAEALVDRPTSA